MGDILQFMVSLLTRLFWVFFSLVPLAYAAPPDDDLIVKYGVVDTSETWSGNIYLVGDVVIGADAVVTVLAGTKLFYAPYDIFNRGDDAEHTEIIVKGKFDVQSTTEAPVTVVSLDEKTRHHIVVDDKTTVIAFSPYKVDTQILRDEFRSFKYQYIFFWSIVYAMWILAI